MHSATWRENLDKVFKITIQVTNYTAQGIPYQLTPKLQML